MIDVHMHLIPSVDDGAADFGMSCDMLDSAYAQGVRGIIATPHGDSFAYCAEEIRQGFEKLSRHAAMKYPDLRLSLGAEVYFSPLSTDYTLSLIRQNKIPTLCASRFVLAEFSPKVQGNDLCMMLHKVLSAGLRPIIAHAERCPDALEDAETVLELLSMGCLIQINAYSLSGETNGRIRTLARTLLERRQVHFLGSDAHRMNHRPPNVENGIRYIKERCSDDYAQAILHQNAERMLFGDWDEDWLSGGMLGLAVGDALGVPHEFLSREELKKHPVTDMTGYGTYHQSAGTWSDDTSMALCCADSLSKGFDERDMMNKFSAWLYRARYTAGGIVFGSGISTRRAINRFNSGYEAELCGGRSEDANGNGSLMRTFPVSVWRLMSERGHALSDEELLRPVHAASALTHAHERSLIACGIYTLFIDEWTRRTLHDSLLDIASRAYERAVRTYREMGGTFAEEIDAPDRFVHPHVIAAWKESDIGSSGYVLDTLHAAFWCLLTTDNFSSCVLKAVNLGEDTDTTAAVVGALAGMIYGAASIPKHWLDTLRNKSLIEPLSKQLFLSVAGKPCAAEIRSFTKEHAHLALKYSCNITLDGLSYSNAHAAWLAQGIPEEERELFSALNAHQARRLFKQLQPVAEWNELKYDLLYDVCHAKYGQNPNLQEKLLSTEDREIIYDTTGAHDNELGWCQCAACSSLEHKNLLGHILMRIRCELRR